MAERAFIALAREWRACVGSTPVEQLLPANHEILSLSCLLLAVEWGKTFKSATLDQAATNSAITEGRRSQNLVKLPWDLCLASGAESPCNASAVLKLTSNLSHDNSSVRDLLMDIGWFVVPWLNPVEASVQLLNNLASTLMGAFKAAGLAARFFDKPEQFISFARDFTPKSFMEQYQDRLKYVEEHGILELQASFWQTEALCRKEIERAGFSHEEDDPIKPSEPQSDSEQDIVTRKQAVDLALASIARELIWSEVYDDLPENLHFYCFKEPEVPCWYVHCGIIKRFQCGGDNSKLLCISRRTGHILLEYDVTND